MILRAPSPWSIFMVLLATLLVAGGFSLLPLSYIPPLLGTGFLITMRLKTGSWPHLDNSLYAWVLALFALGVTSSFWSIKPDETIKESLKVFGLLFFSLPLIDLARQIPEDILRRWQMAIPAATIIAGLYPLIELQCGFPVHQFFKGSLPDTIIWQSTLNESISIFIMMLSPALLICHRSGMHTVSILLLIMATLMIITTTNQAAQLALIILPVAWASLFIFPVSGMPITFGLAALLLILMPWLSPIAFDTFATDHTVQGSLTERAAISQRLESWDVVSRQIMDNPWTGSGLAISDTHPHNLALQIWAELGSIGIIFNLGIFAFLLRRLLKMPRSERRIPFTVFCVSFIFLMISWPIWEGWLLGFTVYLTAITVLALRTSNVRATS